MHRYLPLLALILTAPVQAADIYKWQDSAGRVHYTATPPAHGIPYQRLNKHAEAPPGAEAALQKLREQAGLGGNSQSQDTAPPASIQERTAQRADACQKATANQTLLENNENVARPGPDGRQVVMSPDERADALRQSQREVEFYCNP